MKRTPMPARSVPLPRTPLPSGTGLSRRTPIAPVSGKRQRQNGEYRRLRAAFLAVHPVCEHPDGCPNRATEIQHRRGRRGERLLDVTWWAASCHSCNQDAETATGAALDCGWLVRIEGAA